MNRSLSAPSSEYVLQRFGCRLGTLLLITVVQAIFGYETAFFDLVTLSAGVCGILAIFRGEYPLARTLNHWDEVCGFGLIAYFG